MPKSYEWLHWAEHKDVYGPISAVNVLGQTIVILNTLEVANDMLKTRSAAYSGRPVLQFAGEMIGWNRQMILSTYNDHFKSMRKLVYRYIGTKAAISRHQPIQEREIRYFLARVQDDPSQILHYLRVAVGSIHLQLSHGYIMETSRPDPLVTLVETAAQQFYAATRPGDWLVDIFPSLRRLPPWILGSKFTKTLNEFKGTNLEQANRPHDFVKREMASGSAIPSFTSTLINEKEDEESIKWAANSLYGKSMHTGSCSGTAFFLAMVKNRDVQLRAQKEIDDIVGTSRLPTFADLERLPYVAALHTELLRWHTIGPMGIPHATTDDDVYNGYFIPRGSIVLSNLWLIAHDPDNYDDPMAFKPERFLGPDPQLDPRSYVFGFGRRRCPGLELADATISLAIAMCLSAFTFSCEDQSPVDPRESFIPGTVCHPKPFNFDVAVRSPEKARLMKAVWDELPPPPSNADKL
ncbi:cytochrome P450 oxidoreductase [Punctularia strigosozonata HHB-11173 SS5]|uniref:cytochrome P450 oxidoreductase n=1 Tax=Punctularia strigosozonata (strain HHB-11173) TaxID=741275 RepID=UPI00044169DC|nr:cytochrome P450 oxidoreductase [Punctularia strigosozonata HHB-11173 SS5]EIN11187.1 cytochrome P450 oxidoreductase [Punctularia strigosozonata HHB-11173 SS5]